MKTCIDCKESKSLSDFHKKSNAKDGRQARCKECNKRKAKEWQAQNPERHESYWRERDADGEYLQRKYISRKAKTYGITENEVVTLLAGGRCNICGDPAKNIDHCHVSGKVRGLLCGRCNTGLGLFRDRTDLLARAQDYLMGL